LKCGEKVPGPKAHRASLNGSRHVALPRPLPIAPDDALDLQYFERIPQFHPTDFAFKPDGKSVTLKRGLQNSSHPTIVMTLPWVNFPYTSKPFRYAALAFASSGWDGNGKKVDMANYIAKFRQYTQASATSVMEVVAASYTMLLHAFAACEPFEEMLLHFEGLCAAMGEMAAGGNNQLEFMDSSWQKAVYTLYTVFSRMYNTLDVGPAEFELLEKLHSVLQGMSYRLKLYANADFRNLSVDSIYSRLETLECFMVFHLDHYLARRNRYRTEWDNGMQTNVGRSLRQVLQHIIEIVPRLSTTRTLLALVKRLSQSAISESYLGSSGVLEFHLQDVKSALTFHLAILLENSIISPSSERNDELTVSAAMSLCWLCNIAFSMKSKKALLTTRCLFWAGLVLSEDLFPDGKESSWNYLLMELANKWIMKALSHRRKHRLENSIPARRSYVEYKFMSIIRLLRSANSCDSFHDIWTLTSEDVDVFLCNRLVGTVYFPSSTRLLHT
jgi:hypothetical protein